MTSNLDRNRNTFHTTLLLMCHFQVVPRTLAQNCGANIIRLLTTLRAKHASGDTTWGVDGESGELVDMDKLKIWDPLAVKLQVFKTAVEVSP